MSFKFKKFLELTNSKTKNTFILATEPVRTFLTIVLYKTILLIQDTDNFKVDFIILSIEL